MKLNTVCTTIAGLGLVAQTASAQVNDFRGSDTLAEQVLNLIGPDVATLGTCELDQGATALNLTYAGTGSSNGERRMTADGSFATIEQRIAPMSRFLGDRACRVSDGADAEGYAHSIDALSIVRGTVGTSACDQVIFTGVITVNPGDENADSTVDVSTLGEVDDTALPQDYTIGGGSGAIEGWKDATRILFGGFHQDGGDSTSNQNCDSDVRRALVSEWGNYFESGGCATDACDGLAISHAFRRADFSGTTDTFLSLLGLPDFDESPFCNGQELDDFDPIRRACETDDDICQSMGTVLAGSGSQDACTDDADCIEGELCAGLEGGISGFCTASDNGSYGLVVPILVPEIGLDIEDAYTVDTSGNAITCDFGVFELIQAPLDDSVVGGGDGRCPNGSFQFAGNCFAPAEDTVGNGDPADYNYACLNAVDNNFFVGRRLLTSDGRAHNLILRESNGTIIEQAPGVQTRNAAYRIRTDDCQELSSTLQIGCLTGNVACSVGFAGRDAFTQVAVADGLDLNGVPPLAPNAREFLGVFVGDACTVDADCTAQGSTCGTGNVCTSPDPYPFARFLYLNTVVGFANITEDPYNQLDPLGDGFITTDPVPLTVAAADQETLATCFSERLTVDVSATAAGFVLLSDFGGSCSVTTTTPCNADGDCPGSETCVTDVITATDFDESICP